MKYAAVVLLALILSGGYWAFEKNILGAFELSAVVPAGSAGSAKLSDKAPEAVTEVRAACDTIAVIMRGVPGGKVLTSDGPFEDNFGRSYPTGCSVKVDGTFSALHGTPQAEERLRGPLEPNGWEYDHGYDADGMDGTSFGIRKGAVLCIVAAQWEGGDESDPNNVPGDWYKVSIGCTSDAATSNGETRSR